MLPDGGVDSSSVNTNVTTTQDVLLTSESNTCTMQPSSSVGCTNFSPVQPIVNLEDPSTSGCNQSTPGPSNVGISPSSNHDEQFEYLQKIPLTCLEVWLLKW